MSTNVDALSSDTFIVFMLDERYPQIKHVNKTLRTEDSNIGLTVETSDATVTAR
jgi:hypothetical protein